MGFGAPSGLLTLLIPRAASIVSRHRRSLNHLTVTTHSFQTSQNNCDERLLMLSGAHRYEKPNTKTPKSRISDAVTDWPRDKKLDEVHESY
jgi:hypothetical protein